VRRDLVVVGASAGGVEALRTLVSGFPAELAAAVVVVLHIPSGGTSVLPSILQRGGVLPVFTAEDGVLLRPGRIHVAPPDHHVVVQDGVLRLSRGPTENGLRPAVDVLFRSAALARGAAVVGVVLSGTLDDGTAGMAAIKSRGGLTVVQSPDDAIYPGMPRSVLRHVEVDHVEPVARIGTLIADLVRDVAQDSAPPASEMLCLEVEVSSDDAGGGIGDIAGIGTTTTLTCPDCAGSLVEMPDERTRYRCLVGHAWTADALFYSFDGGLERALWTALRTLEEKTALARRLSAQTRHTGLDLVADRYARQEEEALAAADVLRKYLLRGGLREETGA